MHAIILSIFTAFLHFFHPTPTPHTRMVDLVSGSVVRITGRVDEGSYFCSGEVIAPHRVLTAAHCIGDLLSADGLAVKVIKIDKLYDLALLDVNTSKVPLYFRDAEVVRFEPLTAVGYAWGLTHLTALSVQAFLVNISPANGFAPGIIVQTQYIGGMSGGPVVDEEGLQVGIVQQGNSGAGYGVGVLLIRAFLLGTD